MLSLRVCRVLMVVAQMIASSPGNAVKPGVVARPVEQFLLVAIDSGRLRFFLSVRPLSIAGWIVVADK